MNHREKEGFLARYDGKLRFAGFQSSQEVLDWCRGWDAADFEIRTATKVIKDGIHAREGKPVSRPVDPG